MAAVVPHPRGVHLSSFATAHSPATGFLRWLRAELESAGVPFCPPAAASLAVVLVTDDLFSYPRALRDIAAFSRRGALLPILFLLRQEDCTVEAVLARRRELRWTHAGPAKEWRFAVAVLSRARPAVEVDGWNWRDSMSEAVEIIGSRLGRSSLVEAWRKQRSAENELPYRRGDAAKFVGREAELAALERMLFRCADGVGRRDSKGKKIAVDHAGETQIHEKYVGIACVTGGAGVGKTELILEFARRFSRRYKMVLWVRGAAHHIAHGFTGLLAVLGCNGGRMSLTEPVNFMDLEEEVVEKVIVELSGGIPYLLVVDNLESIIDWWEGRNIMEFLPHPGSATHTIIITRLPRVAPDLEPLLLPPLPGPDAMALLRGTPRSTITADEHAALEALLKRLGGIMLGLSIARAILNELPIGPATLLGVASSMPRRDIHWNEGDDDPILRDSPFLLQLLDTCVLILNLADGHTHLASWMLLASCWSAPSAVPVAVLSHAASHLPVGRRRGGLWRGLRSSARILPDKSRADHLKAEASSALVAFRLARKCGSEGYIEFHHTIRVYAKKRGDTSNAAAAAVVRAISSRATLPYHSLHLWEACFLLLRFGTQNPTIRLKVSEAISFIKRVVIPLASEASGVFFHYQVSILLLGQSTELLEALERSWVSEAQRELGRVPCCGGNGSAGLDPSVYRAMALLRATLLEMRARIMLQGGCYDIAQQLCRSSIGIREVLYGQKHQELVSIGEAMKKALDSSMD